MRQDWRCRAPAFGGFGLDPATSSRSGLPVTSTLDMLGLLPGRAGPKDGVEYDEQLARDGHDGGDAAFAARDQALIEGGEQQQLALARALMSAPRLLLIDEPSVGLAPLLVSHTIERIGVLQRDRRLSVLMAEQNFVQAVRIADRGYVLMHGRIEFAGASKEALNNSELIRKLYLGC